MKAKVVIPRGWKRVTRGNETEGDRELNAAALKWEPVFYPFFNVTVRRTIVIRRKA